MHDLAKKLIQVIDGAPRVQVGNPVNPPTALCRRGLVTMADGDIAKLRDLTADFERDNAKMNALADYRNDARNFTAHIAELAASGDIDKADGYSLAEFRGEREVKVAALRQRLCGISDGARKIIAPYIQQAADAAADRFRTLLNTERSEHAKYGAAYEPSELCKAFRVCAVQLRTWADARASGSMLSGVPVHPASLCGGLVDL